MIKSLNLLIIFVLSGLLSLTVTAQSDQARSEIEARIAPVGDVCLQGDGLVLMGSDCPPEVYEKPQGTIINVQADTPERAEEIFAALSEGGDIRMPMEETFWAKRFGMCSDRFGVPWMVNCDKPMP